MVALYSPIQSAVQNMNITGNWKHTKVSAWFHLIFVFVDHESVWEGGGGGGAPGAQLMYALNS